jgi:hypothetical protein
MTAVVPPRGAVIGTGRSGTGYMAAVLKAAGLDAGHELYWHAHRGVRHSELDVDVSWLALPDIESGRWAGPVLHVVRHPVDTVRSLLGTRLFAESEMDNPYSSYARVHARTVADRFDLAAAVEFWCEWNARCAAVADATIRLEDAEWTGSADPFPLAVERVFGAAFPHVRNSFVHDVSTAARSLSSDVNTRGATPAVDPREVWSLIGRRAHAYGYGA